MEVARAYDTEPLERLTAAYDALIGYSSETEDGISSRLLPIGMTKQRKRAYASMTRLRHEYSGDTGYLIMYYQAEDPDGNHAERSGAFYKTRLDGMPELVSMHSLELTKRMSPDQMHDIYAMLESSLIEYGMHYEPDILCHRQ